MSFSQFSLKVYTSVDITIYPERAGRKSRFLDIESSSTDIQPACDKPFAPGAVSLEDGKFPRDIRMEGCASLLSSH
jgi:hypothetical protein